AHPLDHAGLARLVFGPSGRSVVVHEGDGLSHRRFVRARPVSIEAILPQLVPERRLGDGLGAGQTDECNRRLLALEVLRGLARRLGEIYILRFAADADHENAGTRSDPAQRQRAARLAFESFGRDGRANRFALRCRERQTLGQGGGQRDDHERRIGGSRARKLDGPRLAAGFGPRHNAGAGEALGLRQPRRANRKGQCNQRNIGQRETRHWGKLLIESPQLGSCRHAAQEAAAQPRNANRPRPSADSSTIIGRAACYSIAMKLSRQLVIPFALAASLALSACTTVDLPPASSGPIASADPAPLSALVAEVDIPYETFTLPNGLTTIVHTDRKSPVVGVTIYYRVGSKHEPRGRTGFAHLFEHLMFGGSENVPDFDIPLEAAGSTGTNGSTWYDRTNYIETVPTGALDLALFMESDRMGNLLGAVTQDKL